MKILIIASIPNLNSYEELLASLMQKALISNGHTVDCAFLPYRQNILHLQRQIMAYQLFDAGDADLLITIGYPACFVLHSNKIIYLFETLPDINEYWNTEYGIFENNEYTQIKLSINELEKRTFSNAIGLYVASSHLCADLVNRYSIHIKTVLVPILTGRESKCEFQDEPFYLCETYLPRYSRIESFIRQYKENGIKEELHIYIPSSSDTCRGMIEKMVFDLHIQEWVHLIDGFAPLEKIRKAKKTLFFSYQQRRPDDLFHVCNEIHSPIAVAEDCGYVASWCDKDSLKPFGELCQNLFEETIITNKSVYTNDIHHFIEEILHYEDRTI